MDTLRSRAETLKLARLLDVEPRQLAFLEELPVEDVRAFRERSVAALFDDDPADPRPHRREDEAAARGHRRGHRAEGARAAAWPPPSPDASNRAAPPTSSSGLPLDFTARCCHHVDPRRIAGIMGKLDDDIVVRIALVLADARRPPDDGPVRRASAGLGAGPDPAAARRRDTAPHGLCHRPSRTARPHRRADGRGAGGVGHHVRRRRRAVAGGHGRREHGGPSNSGPGSPPSPPPSRGPARLPRPHDRRAELCGSRCCRSWPRSTRTSCGPSPRCPRCGTARCSTGSSAGSWRPGCGRSSSRWWRHCRRPPGGSSRRPRARSPIPTSTRWPSASRRRICGNWSSPLVELMG